MATLPLQMIMPKTTEEILAINDLLKKMREEKQKRELEAKIQKCKSSISFSVSDSISIIGLEETKRIIRELNRELREFK